MNSIGKVNIDFFIEDKSYKMIIMGREDKKLFFRKIKVIKWLLKEEKVKRDFYIKWKLENDYYRKRR